MFGTCTYTLAIKLNIDWQMVITSRKVYIINGIAFFAALYLVDNFKPCNKHIRILAKNIGFVTKNILLKIL